MTLTRHILSVLAATAIVCCSSCNQATKKDYTYVDLLRDLKLSPDTEVAIILRGYQCHACKEELDDIVDSIGTNRRTVYITTDYIERDAVSEAGHSVVLDSAHLSDRVNEARPMSTVVFFSKGSVAARLPLDASGIEEIVARLRYADRR